MKYIAQSTVIDYKDNYIRRNTEKIFETPFDDFDVCADDRGNIFVLCQDKENGIHLITISGKDVNEKCLLQSKITEGYEKYFNAEYVNGWINALYTIKHDGKNLIIHHTINSDVSPFVLESLENALNTDEWIIDGNYGSTMEMRMKACDTVIFLDLPTEMCISGILERRGKPRSDIPWYEPADSIDEEFLTFVRSYNENSRPRVMELLSRYSDKEMIVLKSRAEADGFLSAQRANHIDNAR